MTIGLDSLNASVISRASRLIATKTSAAEQISSEFANRFCGVWFMIFYPQNTLDLSPIGKLVYDDQFRQPTHKVLRSEYYK